MKKLFMLNLLAIISFFTSGQSIVLPTNLWSNVRSLEPSGQLSTEKIRFTTDTTIVLLTYKFVERTFEEIPLNWSRYGFIREDDNKRVYYKLSASDPEKLFYDLNLALNDSILAFGVNTFNNTIFLDSVMYHVIAIDSFPVGSSYQKQLHLSGNIGGSMMEATQWIDSMGGMNGMLHNWNLKIGEDGYNLICFKENGVLEYQNPFYTDCYVSTGIESPENWLGAVSVTPNPVVDISAVRINGVDKNSAFLVRFYNSLGENVLTRSEGYEFQLRKSELPSGIYLLTIQSMKGNFTSQKIVIR